MTEIRAESATRERREAKLVSASPQAPLGAESYPLSARGPGPSPHQQAGIPAVSSSALFIFHEVHLKEHNE